VFFTTVGKAIAGGICAFNLMRLAMALLADQAGPRIWVGTFGFVTPGEVIRSSLLWIVLGVGVGILAEVSKRMLQVSDNEE
jgi:hypothetical protein